jgi:hypothetical protein
LRSTAATLMRASARTIGARLAAPAADLASRPTLTQRRAMHRLHRLSRSGWVVVGLVLGAIATPASGEHLPGPRRAVDKPRDRAQAVERVCDGSRYRERPFRVPLLRPFLLDLRRWLDHRRPQGARRSPTRQRRHDPCRPAPVALRFGGTFWADLYGYQVPASAAPSGSASVRAPSATRARGRNQAAAPVR